MTDPTKGPEQAGKPPLRDTISHFRLVRELGRGGQGVVYLAEDTRLHRQVALKVLRGFGADSQVVLERFWREAEVASRLNHPGICAVLETGDHEGTPFIVMQYVAGQPFGRMIQSTVTARDAESMAFDLDSDEADEANESPAASELTTDPDDMTRHLRIVEKTARALHAAHEAGIIHRDVKPDNIIVSQECEPVLLDFGMARATEGDLRTLTQTGDLFGTPAYMSPEQLTAQHIRLDRRTDVYSLGVVLFEAVTGRRPFEAPTREGIYQAILGKEPPDARRLNPAVSKDLKVIIETSLEKDRDRRYQSAAELADELRRLRRFEPIHAKPISVFGRAGRWAQRNPVVAALAVLLVVTLSVGAVAGWVSAGRFRELATDARESEARAQREAERSALAEEEVKDHLARSLFEQARALAHSHESGRRGRMLDLVLRARGLGARHRTRPTKQNSATTLPLVRELRSCAVEALLSADTELQKQLSSGLAGGHAFSRDGRYLVNGWIDDERQAHLRLHDLNEDEIIDEWEGVPAKIGFAMDLQDNARFLAVSSMNRPAIFVWDLEDDELLNRIPLSSRMPANVVRMSPDGKFLAAAVNDVSTYRTVLWRLRDKRERKDLVSVPHDNGTMAYIERFSHWSRGVAFDAAGEQLAYAASEHEVAVLSLESGAETRLALPSALSGLLDFDASGECVLAVCTGGRDATGGELVAWDIANNRLRYRLGKSIGSDPSSWTFAPSPDGRVIALGGGSGEFAIISVIDDHVVCSVPDAHKSLINRLQWADGGRSLYTSSFDGTTKRWAILLDSDYRDRIFLGRQTEIVSFAFEPRSGSASFLHSGERFSVTCLDASGKEKWSVPVADRLKTVASYEQAFSRDGARFAEVIGREVHLRDAKTGNRLKPSWSVERAIFGIAFDDRDHLVALGLDDGEVILFDLDANSRVWSSPDWTRNALALQSASISDDGSSLVTWNPYLAQTSGAQIQIFDLRQGKGRRFAPQADMSQLPVATVYLSPTKRYLVTTHTAAATGGVADHSSSGGDLTVWEAGAGTARVEVRGDFDPWQSQWAFTDDDRYLAIAHGSGTVRLWDLSRAEELFSFRAHKSPIIQLMFFNDGKSLASTDGAGEVRIWHVATLIRKLNEMGL